MQRSWLLATSPIRPHPTRPDPPAHTASSPHRSTGAGCSPADGSGTGGIQVVGMNGVQVAIDLCRDGHGAAGRGLKDDSRAVALACGG